MQSIAKHRRCAVERPHKVPKGLQWDFFGPMLLADWAAPAYDPAEARRLLKEAGYDGAPIPYQMLNNYYTNQLQTGQIMAEQWKAVGLNVVMEMKENWSQILGRFPGRGICENSNSSWFNDPVALAGGLRPGRPDLGSGPVGERRSREADGPAAERPRPRAAPPATSAAS